MAVPRVTARDSRSGQVRSFRLDRMTRAVVQGGAVLGARRVRPGGSGDRGGLGGVVPARGLGAGPRQRAGGADADARTDRHHRASQYRTRMGAGAMASRRHWVPSVLAGLDRPFVIEKPDELRERVRALAGQLASYAEAR